MQLSFPSVLLHLVSAAFVASAASDKPLKPCTAVSPTTERFFDLNPLHRTGDKKKEGDGGSWHARGHDYGANFTINFCGPVVEELTRVEDLDKDLWKNVSAYYEKGDRQYALGLESYEPVFRGRKLVLNYTGGSLCPGSSSSKALATPIDIDLHTRSLSDDEDEDDYEEETSTSSTMKSSERRKTAIISLLCESDPLAKTAFSFVAAVDDCVYIFEGRSPHACGGVHVQKQALGPGGVFGVIVLIAILVYLVGGCVYQRTVMHQRGWRQLPNYHMWAGMARFVVVCPCLSYASTGIRS